MEKNFIPKTKLRSVLKLCVVQAMIAMILFGASTAHDNDVQLLDKKVTLNLKEISLEKKSLKEIASITGKVTDAVTQQPMPGVNIIQKGTTNGTTTDGDGKYSLEVLEADAVLVFSFIGYVTQEVAVNGRTVIDVVLVEDVKNLEEVVVVGYGVQRRSDITGSVGIASKEDLQQPTFNAMQRLRGKVYVSVYDPAVDLRIQNQQFFFNSIELNGQLFEFDQWATYLWHDDRALFETGQGDKDMTVYRYAEVLLIAAEAIARSEGVTSEAVGYLADVRARAYWQTDRNDIVSAVSALPEQEFVEEVWKERLRELPLEYRTWSDIQRTRLYPVTSVANPGEVDFVNVVGHSNNWGQTFQEHHLLIPLPLNELNRNPELTQNPGY